MMQRLKIPGWRYYLAYMAMGNIVVWLGCLFAMAIPSLYDIGKVMIHAGLLGMIISTLVFLVLCGYYAVKKQRDATH